MGGESIIFFLIVAIVEVLCTALIAPFTMRHTMSHSSTPLPSPPSSTLQCPASPSFMVDCCYQPLSCLLQPPSPAGPVVAYALPRAAILCLLSGPLGTLLIFFIG